MIQLDWNKAHTFIDHLILLSCFACCIRPICFYHCASYCVPLTIFKTTTADHLVFDKYHFWIKQIQLFLAFYRSQNYEFEAHAKLATQPHTYPPCIQYLTDSSWTNSHQLILAEHWSLSPLLQLSMAWERQGYQWAH